MQILRHAFVKESDYIFANCYLYNHVGNNWDDNENARDYIKPSINFLAGCLDSVKTTITPITTRETMFQLLAENFPRMLPYIRQESRNQGLGSRPIELTENIPIDLDFFIGSINFYTVCLIYKF